MDAKVLFKVIPVPLMLP